MPETILITGGAGFIGSALTDLLIEKGYAVHLLSRKPHHSANPNVKFFSWNVNAGTLQTDCFENVTAIIHLAGENIAEKPWTRDRRRAIIQSRTDSIRLIYQHLARLSTHQIKAVISASGSGYYGNRGDLVLTEDSLPGDTFLSKTCIEWEAAAKEGEALGLRVVLLRTGIALGRGAGALPQLEKPIRAGVAAPIGSGRQWMPWIHLEDIIRMYAFALENATLSGAYNACAPAQVTNAQFTEALRQKLGRSIRLPGIPALVLRMMLGQMSEMVLASTRMSSYHIEEAGFSYKFPTLQQAFNELYQ